ncbi:hypothetical protein K488DRAFT_48169 [Vararia minispora EC-137]|uniref:Uncharacterized protein n=1 Tax=Vararia minispora EC-137 TaxID=1314806 RepID=A0ACB8QNH4_9AGAM|nr:hypothetical protein K488DRAFT_48169 [Vararia minispora EC-137]
MKCEFPANSTTCKRCSSGNHDCIIEGRKPRSAPNKRAYLLAALRQKDGIIESLLKQLHNPYLSTPLSIAAYRMATADSDHHRQNVISWLDRLQSTLRDPGSQPDLQTFTLGVGTPNPSNPFSHNGGDRTTHPALPEASAPLGLLAKLSVASARVIDSDKASKQDDDESPVGVANEAYFVPGPSFDLRERMRMIDKTAPPDLLVHGIVTPDEVDNLFQIFYTRVNPFVGVLDPVLHTPSSTFSRSSFLFAAVCAIALRFSDKAEAYPVAMHFAQSAAASALIDGCKSVELCQAYILLSMYGIPVRRLEQDRACLYAGLAIQIATDLRLDTWSALQPSNEAEAREMINRTRIWMLCFNLDKTTSLRSGKRSMVREDKIIRDGLTWYNRFPENDPFDVHLVAHTSILRLLTHFDAEIFSDPDQPLSLSLHVDFREVALRYDTELVVVSDDWTNKFSTDSDPNNPAAVLRCKLLPLYVAYGRLAILSFALEQALQRGSRPSDDVFYHKARHFWHGFRSAVIGIIVDLLAPSGYLRYAPDEVFTIGAFAAAFMFELLHPRCRTLVEKAEKQSQSIYDAIERLIATFSAPTIIIDERHTPKLYADFLGRTILQHRNGLEQDVRLPLTSPSLSATGVTSALTEAYRHVSEGLSADIPEVPPLEACSTNSPEERDLPPEAQTLLGKRQPAELDPGDSDAQRDKRRRTEIETH